MQENRKKMTMDDKTQQDPESKDMPAMPGHGEQDIHVHAFVGRQIRERRQRMGMTISELADASGVSTSNLSKIETGQVSPPLQSLDAIAHAISTPIHELFRGYDEEGILYYVAKGKGMEVRRPGNKVGFTSHLLANQGGQSSNIEPYIVTLKKPMKQGASFSHSGMEFIYMLEGDMQYRYGKRVIDIAEGDALIFDGRTPHGPERISGSLSRYLTILTRDFDDG